MSELCAGFMWDRHLFTRINITTPWRVAFQAWRLFRKDGCGTLFVRVGDCSEIRELTLNGRVLSRDKWGVPWQEIAQWSRKVCAADNPGTAHK